MIRPDIAGTYIEKAERSLESCRTLMQDSDTVGACNRAYYAMFYAAHAVLWEVGGHELGSMIKTHSGLISAFGQKLVFTGRIGPEHGRALARVQHTRLLADYSAEPPTGEEAETSLRLASSFVAAMGQALTRPPPVSR